ncbi:MAG: TonB-dependent receptor [Caulobacteraceae bacterium]
MGIACAQDAPKPAASASSDTPATLNEVVVTANKRSENILKVPETLTSLSGAQLQSQGVKDFADLVAAVPSLSAINAGAPGHGTPIIRGITTGSGQSAPTVSIYLDEVPFTSTSPINGAGALITFDPALADIDHVEVLEGPQSTLYGASAMGGIIKYVSKQPSMTTYGGDVSVSGDSVDGGGAGYALKGTVNIPLVDDKAGLRVTVIDRSDPGWVDNVLTHQSDVNASRTQGVRAALKVQPIENLTSTFSFLYQKIDGSEFSYEYVNPTTQQPLYGPHETSDYFNSPYKTTYLSAANTTTATLPMMTIVNAISYARTSDNEVKDYSPSWSYLIPAAYQPAAVEYNAAPLSNRLTDEIRFSSKPGALEWMVGGFFTHEWDTYNVLISGLSVPTLAMLPGTAGNIYTYHATPTFDEESGFGDLTYHFGRQFDISAGVRYSTNQQEYNVVRSGLLGASPLAGTSGDSAATYSFTGSYHPTEQVTLYLRAASAYRPGSTQPVNTPSVPAEYGPDKLWNYEGGVKGRWWDGRITASASVYHIDWSDIQLTARVGGFNVISNAGNATVDGGEINFVIQPIEGLTLHYAGALTDAVLHSDDAAIGASAGDPLPFTSRYNHTVGADYNFSLPRSAEGVAGVTWTYQGSRHTSFPGDPLNTDERLPAYQTAGAHIGANFDRYTVDLRVDNLTNSDAFTSESILRRLAGQDVPAIATTLQPRTVTFTVGARF